jgi:hypothetical protein
MREGKERKRKKGGGRVGENEEEEEGEKRKGTDCLLKRCGVTDACVAFSFLLFSFSLLPPCPRLDWREVC